MVLSGVYGGTRLTMVSREHAMKDLEEAPMPRCIWRHLLGTMLVTWLLALPARAQEAETVFREDFNTTTAPQVPPGWVTGGSGWVTSGTSPSPGSGGNNLAHTGTQPGQIAMPVVDLSRVTAGTFRYQVRRSGTYALENLIVTASTDGGATFPITLLAPGSALPEQDGVYRTIEAALPEAVLGQAQVVFRFEAQGGSGGMSVLRIDDVLIEGVVPVRVTPSHLAFFAPPASVQEQVFTVTNQSGQEQAFSAPVVAPAVFSVSPATAVTLEDGASQVYTVTFSPSADGQYEGTVALSSTAGSFVVSLSGTTSGGRLGFDATASTALEEAMDIDIPLVLQYAGTLPLQGIEFSVSWDDATVSLVDIVRGASIENEAAWRLAYEAGAQTVKVVLLAEGTTGLPAQDYAPLFRLRFESGSIAPDETREVGFSLHGVIGALASATGEDAGLTTGLATHTLTLTRGSARFVPSATHLDLGVVTVGEQAEARLTITNAGGGRALSITEIQGTNDLFTIAPTSATIPPESSQEFTVTFKPEATLFGLQTGAFTFEHDGEDGPFSLSVRGTGVGGRGDADGDGIVDVLDLIYGIDFVLGRLVPTPAQQASTDLYPFSTGDGALDVRDLTILSHAIVGGKWPDDVTLPLEPHFGLGKTELASDVRVRLQWEDGQWVVQLDHAIPLRALELIVQVEGLRNAPSVLQDADRPSGVVLVRGNTATGEVRMLYYRPDADVLPPGRYLLAGIPAEGGTGGPVVLYATAVDADRLRVPVVTELLMPTATELVPEAGDAFEVGVPYPNPFRPDAGTMLHIPVSLRSGGNVQATIYDVTGRLVGRLVRDLSGQGAEMLQWDGRREDGQRVAPGWYVVRVRSAAGEQAKPILIMP